jgi:hypothetical protein
MRTYNTAYRSAVGVALAAAFILVWMVLALGVLGREGDLADLMYIGVLAVGIIGAIIARFQPPGMARALLATALAQALVAVIALIAGKHQAAVSSVAELLGLNGFFVALFLGSAWLFRKAAREQPPASIRPSAWKKINSRKFAVASGHRAQRRALDNGMAQPLRRRNAAIK